MGIKAENRDGVFVPLQEVRQPAPGEAYQVLSASELKSLTADVVWLKGSERGFEYWEN